MEKKIKNKNRDAINIGHFVWTYKSTGTQLIARSSPKARCSFNWKLPLCLGHPNVTSSSTLSATKYLSHNIKILYTLNIKNINWNKWNKYDHNNTIL